MVKGTVKWYNKNEGFGFIAPDGGSRDIYVRSSQIETPDHDLSDGQRVEYEPSTGRKGPEAIHVKVLS